MKRLSQEIGWFLHQKIYVGMLCLTALCSYGFAVTGYSIGIDDTAVGLYLEDGLTVVRGRWTIFLINKLFHMSDFTPFMMELAGVLLLMLGVTLFAVLLKRIFGEKVGIWGYILFACMFLSNPMIGKIYVYYYHTGVDLGYILTALALMFFMDGMEQKKGRRKLWSYLGSMLLIWAAVGCYESFLILYVLGILVILFLRGMTGKEKLTFLHVAKHLGIGALLSVGSILLRNVTLEVVTIIFQLQNMESVSARRSLFEMSELFRGREGLSEFFMLIKRFWLVYHVNALVYLPITVYELACACVGGYAVFAAVRKKNIWYPVLFAGMLVTPFLLTIIETHVTFYRSCQYLPFFAALGALLLYQAFGQWKYSGYWRYAVVFGGVILIYNQAFMMNRDFYMDYREYELAKETLTGIAYDVEKQYGREIPVVLVGEYELPYEFTKYYYVGYDSWQYRMIAGITDLVDEHLKEKYFEPQGYCFIGEKNLPMIRWGFDAFDGTNRELMRFLEMHGYSFATITDKEEIERAREIGETMPRWPQEGSISLQNGYVLVNL
ncbi:MAG: glucosyltransferase domain-containing protein [Bacteroidales bacterium]|nr:glucosyltransferase domain-containing protein [Lachnoclostridium sp.]MCM1383238.1 glucosyltransferase domain-containing protein [Lachnoclostridium sp.]MCM1466485.1 glucosyltransferase domain-containing protein [Bacteroidales bacterium]